MEDEKQNSTHAGVSAPYKMIRVIHEKIIQLDFLNHIELEHKLYNDISYLILKLSIEKLLKYFIY